MVGGGFMVIVAGFLWGAIYYALGERTAAVIPTAYGLVSLVTFAIFIITRRYQFFRTSQLVLILLLPFLLLVALGGYVNSSIVIVWAFLCPMGALIFGDPRRAHRWFLAYFGLIIAAGLMQPILRPANNLSQGIIYAFFILNIGAVSIIAFVGLRYFINQKDIALDLLSKEQAKSERLLLNVLPRQIAAELKNNGHTIAEHFDAISILFADVVNFTPLSEQFSPRQMVEVLNEVFSYFDVLVERYGVEKIRTIGDSYMVVAGAPIRRSDHAQALAHLALGMLEFPAHCTRAEARHLQFRIGINTGPAVAGVIGQQKFHYDVWGDAVNIASRMESHGVPGKIQITAETHALLGDDFIRQRRGLIDVKGKGQMETWFLEGLA